MKTSRSKPSPPSLFGLPTSSADVSLTIKLIEAARDSNAELDRSAEKNEKGRINGRLFLGSADLAMLYFHY